MVQIRFHWLHFSDQRLGNDEKEIQIIPEEVFSGTPQGSLTVRTSQGACFPPIALGDRWLFYLPDGDPILLDYFGGKSRPVSETALEIDTLRRLKTIGARGLLRGHVVRGEYSQYDPVANARVIAHLLSETSSQFVATTNTEGQYEFPPLPPGHYDLTVDPVGSFQADKDDAVIKSGSCTDLTLGKSPHGQIGGHARRTDGTPLSEVEMTLSDEKGTSYFATTNRKGIFQFDSVRAGKYILEVNLAGTSKSRRAGGADRRGAIPVASIYYPGTPDRSGALVIVLAEDEQKTDVDFSVPLN